MQGNSFIFHKFPFEYSKYVLGCREEKDGNKDEEEKK